MIVDYSTARPGMGTLRSAGVTAVGRYIGWDSVPGYSSIGKNMSVGEAAELHAEGIAIFLAFEYNANAAANGTSQGVADGQLALKQLAELGAPPTMTVYFAVDFDIPDYAPSLPDTAAYALAKLGPVGKYFQAIKGLEHPYEIGVYGGYYAVKRVLDAGLATKGWQTAAWSGGKQDMRSVIMQLVSAAPIAGADVDVRMNLSTQSDYGQWPRPNGPTPPAGPTYLTPAQMGTIMAALPALSSGMADSKLPAEYIRRLQATLLYVYGYTVNLTGVYDAATVAGVKNIQHRYGLTEDGICGPATWAPIVTGAK
jgi:hypothetical protein